MTMLYDDMPRHTSSGRPHFGGVAHAECCSLILGARKVGLLPPMGSQDVPQMALGYGLVHGQVMLDLQIPEPGIHLDGSDRLAGSEGEEQGGRVVIWVPARMHEQRAPAALLVHDQQGVQVGAADDDLKARHALAAVLVVCTTQLEQGRAPLQGGVQAAAAGGRGATGASERGVGDPLQPVALAAGADAALHPACKAGKLGSTQRSEQGQPAHQRGMPKGKAKQGGIPHLGLHLVVKDVPSRAGHLRLSCMECSLDHLLLPSQHRPGREHLPGGVCAHAGSPLLQAP